MTCFKKTILSSSLTLNLRNHNHCDPCKMKLEKGALSWDSLYHVKRRFRYFHLFYIFYWFRGFPYISGVNYHFVVGYFFGGSCKLAHFWRGTSSRFTRVMKCAFPPFLPYAYQPPAPSFLSFYSWNVSSFDETKMFFRWWIWCEYMITTHFPSCPSTPFSFFSPFPSHRIITHNSWVFK